MDGKVTNEIKTESGRTIAMEGYEADQILVVAIWDRQKRPNSAAIGHAILLSNPNTDALMLINICIYDECNRGKGAADDLMEFMTTLCPHIVTSHQNQAGMNLCLKHDFVLQKGMFKKDADLLVYRRINGENVDELEDNDVTEQCDGELDDNQVCEGSEAPEEDCCDNHETSEEE